MFSQFYEGHTSQQQQLPLYNPATHYQLPQYYFGPTSDLHLPHYQALVSQAPLPQYTGPAVRSAPTAADMSVEPPLNPLQPPRSWQSGSASSLISTTPLVPDSKIDLHHGKRDLRFEEAAAAAAHVAATYDIASASAYAVPSTAAMVVPGVSFACLRSPLTLPSQRPVVPQYTAPASRLPTARFSSCTLFKSYLPSYCLTNAAARTPSMAVSLAAAMRKLSLEAGSSSSIGAP